MSKAPKKGSPAALFAEVVGRAVHLRRKEKGKNQADLAGELRLAQASYSRLEKGRSVFNVVQLRVTASAMGLTPDEVLLDAVQGAAQLEHQGVQVLNGVTDGDGQQWNWVAEKTIEGAIEAAREARRMEESMTKSKQRAHAVIPAYVRHDG